MAAAGACSCSPLFRPLTLVHVIGHGLVQMPNENLLVVEMKLVQRTAVEHCLHPLARAGVLKNDVIEIGDRQFLAEPLPLRGWRRIEHLHRSEDHTSELQSLMRNSYAVFCLKKKTRRKSP